MPQESVAGLAEAEGKVKLISPGELQVSTNQVIIFVDTSQEFAQGHVPGARWVPRGWMEFQIGDMAPDKDGVVVVTGNSAANAVLAGAMLQEMGYSNVRVLEGGMSLWRQQGLSVETGLSGVMSPPNDMVASGPDRNYADMITYLRWETALGEKYAT